MGYIILRALKRQKKKNVLLLIQFFVGFLAMFLAIAMVQNIWRYRQQIQQLVPERAIQMANYEEDGQTGEDKQVQAYEKVVQKLEKEKEIERSLLFENIILQLDEQEEVYHGMTGRFTLSHAHRLHENLVETGGLAQDDRLTRLAGHAT